MTNIEDHNNNLKNHRKRQDAFPQVQFRVPTSFILRSIWEQDWKRLGDVIKSTRKPAIHSFFTGIASGLLLLAVYALIEVNSKTCAIYLSLAILSGLFALIFWLKRRKYLGNIVYEYDRINDSPTKTIPAESKTFADLDPKDAERKRRISNLLLEVNNMMNKAHDYNSALEAAKEVLELDPNNLKALSYIGLIYDSFLKNEPLAAETYEKMVEIVGNIREKSDLDKRRLGKYHSTLARLYISMGQENRMLLNFRKAYNINPGIVINLLILKIFEPYKEQLLKEFPDLKRD